MTQSTNGFITATPRAEFLVDLAKTKCGCKDAEHFICKHLISALALQELLKIEVSAKPVVTLAMIEKYLAAAQKVSA